ncbi:EAL domain-containing protein [Acetobacterium wieringae]|uniref:bifunctional diguanylate cyclase/phosphodiesterase n=1 Tax=Acetobacterium wieringae TaxID=52694 RepID=UPI002033A3A3|nr:EAL domain-containing protein [Acetobacterium wieringae]URN84474.1 EAL domain-containing protein [Acetobacterium wieringae]
MHWFKKSLIRRVGTIVIGFIFVAFAVYGIISIQMLSGFFETNSKEQISKDAQQIATEIDKFIEKNIIIVEQMKTNQDYQAITEALNTREEKRQHPLFNVITQELQAIKASDPNISLAYIGVTKSNDLISSTPEFDPKPDYDLNKRLWYMETLQSRGVTVTSPYIDIVTEKMVVSITTPILKNNNVIGAMGIDLQVTDISKLMSTYKVGKNGYTLLINKDGSIFYHPDDPEVFAAGGVNPFAYLDLYMSQITSGDSGVIEYQMGNNAKYIAYVPTQSSNWIVVTVIPRSEVLAPLNQFIFSLFFISLVLLFMIALFIRRMTRLISEPIITISGAVETFSQGDQEINLPSTLYDREDELGILSRGLKMMSHRIIQYIEEVQTNNQALNQEIDKRQAVQSQLEMILELLSGTDEGIFILNAEFFCIYQNTAFSRMIGIPETEIPALNLSEKGILINQPLIDSLEMNPVWSGEIEYAQNSSETLFLFLRISKVKNDDTDYYIGNITNLTAHKQIEKDIYYLKYFDYLTKLNNKVFLDESGMELISGDGSAAGNHALILINIDDFRIINEAKGFDFGNKVLIALASRLKTLVSDQDVLARLGNDEFGILKAYVSSNEDLYEYIMDLSKELEKQISIHDEELIVDVSIGISLYPNDANHYGKLLKTAASALNNVKANKGRRFEFYDKDINSLSIQKYEMQNKLRNALSNQEFVLYYQPQVDMATNQILGLEALIRWNSSNGMVPPGSFIPIAEESNLITPLGEWVLEIACEFGKKLQSLGYQIPIAVNLSMLQFKAPYIGELIQSILTRTQLPPELLELEITEGILMDNEDECEAILSEFHRMGIQVSIDDFGTGYSSLSYLKKFAVDKIKIDRSFIKGIPHYDNGTIAKVIIELASNFNLQVIAEGVETPEQIDFLLKNNCHIAQGFYYAKPLDEDRLLTFMEKTKRDMA